jgi:uncharacterized protein YfiM (DUF2279 family)
MRIPSGVTDQYIYFVAVDSSDLITRETGLSSFTVRRSRNGGASAAYTTPTINETDSSNMPGVYELLLDEDMTIDSGDQSQEVCLHITHAGMAPVTRVFELYRPSVTAGETLTVASGVGQASVQSFANNALTAAAINADAFTAAKFASDVTTEFQSGLATAASLATVAGYLDTEIAAILEDTGTTIPAQIAALNNLSAAQVNAEVDTALADYDAPTKAELDAAVAPLATQASVNDLPTNAELATALGTADDAVLAAIGNLNNLSAAEVNAEVDTAIADAFTFTVAGQVDANIQYVNDVQVIGNGEAGTEWGPA